MKKILRVPFFLTALLLGTALHAQLKVGTSPTALHPSAVLEAESSSRGFLVPRMTQVQRVAIASPATGLLVYQTDATSGFWYFNGTVWVSIDGFVTQTYQNVTAARALGTTYTNTTGRAIQVLYDVIDNCGTTTTQNITVSGVAIGKFQSGGGFANTSFSFIVPPGATYSIAASGCVLTYRWVELR